jgi:hypothetical protein
MKRKLVLCSTLMVAISAGIMLPAMAQERAKSSTGDLSKAPQAVQKAVKQLVGKNPISEVGPETTLGKTLWVVEFDVKGVEYAFGLDPDGKVVARWVGVNQSLVPPEVLEAAKKAHPNGKVSEVAIATVGDRMFYSVDVKTAGAIHEMEISPGGSVTADRIEGKED